MEHTCDIKGCEETKHNEGLCKKHYTEMIKYKTMIGNEGLKETTTEDKDEYCKIGWCYSKVHKDGYCRRHL
ncbi:hypothetical protein COF68_04555 [Bacillus toyonensis]|uniref:hypothetical protein n=1 Tax=Bacillus toyonensis TaxID=155322 RepID=UPI000BFB584C|nr:hypothetical protein [Bacillus toyonensis]PHE64125.1 hypothetical protein COF68_04555 [Bacillus toyonensis]